MKVVVNRCFGGYALSIKAYEFLGLDWDGHGFDYCDDRSNTELIKCIESLGKDANGRFAKLEIVEIPDDVKYYINDYDGSESIHEEHRSW